MKFSQSDNVAARGHIRWIRVFDQFVMNRIVFARNHSWHLQTTGWRATGMRQFRIEDDCVDAETLQPEKSEASALVCSNKSLPVCKGQPTKPTAERSLS